mmetsp:Transcript_17919/g.38180  ORF Transcript_17919/g.38180 Transcript_17919/m.38180 type:complete len:202 (+) Transcript_17919:267-872(+)
MQPNQAGALAVSGSCRSGHHVPARGRRPHRLRCAAVGVGHHRGHHHVRRHHVMLDRRVVRWSGRRVVGDRVRAHSVGRGWGRRAGRRTIGVVWWVRSLAVGAVPPPPARVGRGRLMGRLVLRSVEHTDALRWLARLLLAAVVRRVGRKRGVAAPHHGRHRQRHLGHVAVRPAWHVPMQRIVRLLREVLAVRHVELRVYLAA